MCIYDDPATLTTEVDTDAGLGDARGLTRPDLVRRVLADPVVVGIPVRFSDGWEHRGLPQSFSPAGVVCHHTATARTRPGDYPSLALIIGGTSDLQGPLAQFGLGRSGAIYVIAAGTANHAGPGRWRGLKGNSRVWGIEAENDGVGEPWTEGQLYSYPRLCAALARVTGFSEDMVCAHREWAPDRKIDPTGIDMPAFRAHVALLLSHRPPRKEEEDMAVLFWNEGGLYLAWAGRRSNWGLLPETCDALLSTKDVKIIGTHGRRSELMGVLPPFAPAGGGLSSDAEQGYSFSEEEAAALMERVTAMAPPSAEVTA